MNALWSLTRWTVAFALAAFAMTAGAQQAGDPGQREFDSNCRACHAVGGVGGDYVQFLNVMPTDLTKLAENNGGVFPFARVYEAIDGRLEVPGHGARDMPVWGRDYLVRAGEYYIDVPYDPEVYVRGRILALIDYLNRVQGK